MDDDVVIKVENLNKKFCRSLKRSMAYGFIDMTKNLLGRPTNQSKLRKGEFWALEDISFELKKGEILGIIGVNGSGKSTLLRVLTGIFPPDKGKIIVKGRIGALIAVGAGFHPHFTGRENIYLNGVVLGMTRKEIDEKFQDIIQFADIGNFLDAPVSTYSSGMKVRLGFAIAIHSVPEILLIDEVLAVGDISFRKKCMEKIEEIKHQCSIIFISHNMNQVERICDKVILMDKGKVLCEGNAQEVINRYYDQIVYQEASIDNDLTILESTEDIYDLKIKLTDNNGQEQKVFKYDSDITFNFEFSSKSEIVDPVIAVDIVTMEGIIISSIKNINSKEDRINRINKGINKFSVTLKKVQLLPGTYKISFKWKLPNNTTLFHATGKRFGIQPEVKFVNYEGIFNIEAKWQSN